jgi:hypothetical protein
MTRASAGFAMGRTPSPVRGPCDTVIVGHIGTVQAGRQKICTRFSSNYCKRSKFSDLVQIIANFKKIAQDSFELRKL